MIKSRLFSSGQSIALATGENYILKDDEVWINNHIYKKYDLEITLKNMHQTNTPEFVGIGIRKRDGVLGLPSNFWSFKEWEIDGITQTSLSVCVNNITTAIQYIENNSNIGVNTFSDLTDTINNYAGLENQILVINSSGTGITTIEQSLLESLFLGTYTSLLNLTTAHPTPQEGSYANIDTGTSNNVQRALWDNNDNQWVLGSNVSMPSITNSKVLYVNKALGDNTSRPLKENDIYIELDEAIKVLMADTSKGQGWSIEITDDETYNLITDFTDDVAKYITVRSNRSPIVNQDAAYNVYGGVFDIEFKNANKQKDNGASWNFNFTDNVDNKTYKVGYNFGSSIFKFIVPNSTITENAGLAYTPIEVFELYRIKSLVYEVDYLKRNATVGIWGGSTSTNFIGNVFNNRYKLNINLFEDYSSLARIDALANPEADITIKNYHNLSGVDKVLGSNGGAEDNSLATYIIGNVKSPNAKVFTTYAVSTPSYMEHIFLGGTLENFYFDTVHPSSKRHVFKGINPNTEIILNYTIPTTKAPFKLYGRVDNSLSTGVNGVDTDPVNYATTVKDLQIVVKGGVNVAHDIVETSKNIGTLNSYILWQNSSIKLENDVNVNIFDVDFSVNNILPPLTVMGDCYFKVNDTKFLFNYTSTEDPTGLNVVDIVGSIKLLGEGSITNDARLTLTDAHILKHKFTEDVNFKNYPDGRDDGLPTSIAWYDANGNLKRSPFSYVNPSTDYENVTSIPSYLIADGETVIDKGDGTFDILKTQKGHINLSLFGSKDDLTYLDVTTDGTTPVILSALFTQEDVGKSIVIHKAHQNPNTIDGSEVSNTVLGRIVSFKATINSVIDGVSATLNGIPNKSGVLRAYTYTNNAEALYKAISFCYYKNIQELIIDYQNILGVDVFNKGIYSSVSNAGIRLLANEGSLKITTTGAKFKCTNEGDTREIDFFDLETGNGNFYLDVPVLPADEFEQNPQTLTKSILNVDNANHSIRNITIKNQKWSKADTDNKDSFWTKLLDSDSTGGEIISGERRSQIFYIEDCAVRSKSGGIACFQNNTYSNEIYLKDVYINDRQHYIGEKWRDTYTDEFDTAMYWDLPTTNFSVSSNVITTTEEDFSWYDFQNNGTSFEVIIGAETARILSITDAKTATLEAGITDQSNVDIKIKLYSRTFYNHGLYISPAMILEMIRCKSNPEVNGNIKMFSASGDVDSSIGIFKIHDSELYNVEVEDGGTTSTETKTHISSSKVHFYGMSGFCTVKGSNISGTFVGRSFISEGGNIYNLPNCIVNGDNEKFISIGERGMLDLKFTGSNTYVWIQSYYLEDNEILPITQNGETNYVDIRIPDNVMHGQWDAGSITANTILNFINFKTDYHDNNFSLFNNMNYGVGQFNFINSRFYANWKDENSMNFDNTNSNIGSIEVVDESHNFYVDRIHPDFNLWNFYKELEYASLNPMESNYWIIEDFKFSMIIASFGYIQNKTNISLIKFTDDRGREYLRNYTPLFRGKLQTIFKGDSETNPYQHSNGAGAFNSSLRENTTFSNMVVKSIKREDGEIVTWNFDNQGRFVEVSSTVQKRYVSVAPTHLGVEDERYYSDNVFGRYWEYAITFADASTETFAGIQADVQQKDDTDANTFLNTHITLNTPQEFSIFQEKSDGTNLVDFGFSLPISGGGTLDFVQQTDFAGNSTTISINEDYTKNLWHFKGSNNAYECIMNNRTGEIIFNGIITETLDTTGILTINTGQKITNRQWIQIN